MKVLLVGTGGVGEAIATIVQRRGSRGQWLERPVLGDRQYARARDWDKAGRLALCGSGVEPGMAEVEHEEILQMFRYPADRGLKRVTFKYDLGEDFIRTLKILQCLGLERSVYLCQLAGNQKCMARIGSQAVVARDRRALEAGLLWGRAGRVPAGRRAAPSLRAYRR